MWRQAVLLDNVLYAHVAQWAGTGRGGNVEAIRQIVDWGLRVPDATKRALSRQPARRGQLRLGVKRGGVNEQVCLRDDVAAQVALHRVRYGLASMSEAVRDLLRLGMCLPPVAHEEHAADQIRRLSASMQQGGIAARLGISRQRVSAALKDQAHE